MNPLRMWLGRIIPAGAGKRRKRLGKVRFFQDHPRGCGEKLVWLFVRPFGSGSSPRVRGKDGVDNAFVDAQWIIPAGAGKS